VEIGRKPEKNKELLTRLHEDLHDERCIAVSDVEKVMVLRFDAMEK
jgi:hypothetical protein